MMVSSYGIPFIADRVCLLNLLSRAFGRQNSVNSPLLANSGGVVVASYLCNSLHGVDSSLMPQLYISLFCHFFNVRRSCTCRSCYHFASPHLTASQLLVHYRRRLQLVTSGFTRHHLQSLPLRALC